MRDDESEETDRVGEDIGGGEEKVFILLEGLGLWEWITERDIKDKGKSPGRSARLVAYTSSPAVATQGACGES
ncbi:hypothetical protein PHLCEN_2v1841 [Hermanssonia centrifuga]|uniref:Uncharacterized protein n=1 Tax=Hermanssonia centrifuga TaxID=98765 RepID=A0A2R6RVS6_9APHY|nr:hypothetical protein PHLCEN_2v1841 [Hermanssonia centrifuga]